MAKVKYDVSKVEKRSFEVPKPGVYTAHIHEMSHGESQSSGNPMFTVVFEITKGDYKGSRIWYYILTDGSQEWRLREFTDALGLKPKGEIDTDALKGTVVQLRTDIDPARDGYSEKARIKNVLPAGDNASDGDGGDDDEAPYEEWELADLKEEVEARELKITGKATKKKLIAALEADDAESGDDEEDEEDEDAEDAEEGDDESLTMEDLEKMDRNELKGLIKEEELDIKVTKSKKDDDLRAAIAEALEIEESEDEDDEEEEEDEPPAKGKGKSKAKAKPSEEEEGDDEDEDTDYEEWDVADLKAELKERGLKADGRKSVLVARLKKDDESDDEPF